MRFEGKKWETLGRNTELQKCKTYRILAPITLSAGQDQTEMFLLLFQPRYNPWICLLAAPESVSQGRLQESSGVFQCMMQKSLFFFPLHCTCCFSTGSKPVGKMTLCWAQVGCSHVFGVNVDLTLIRFCFFCLQLITQALQWRTLFPWWNIFHMTKPWPGAVIFVSVLGTVGSCSEIWWTCEKWP